MIYFSNVKLDVILLEVLKHKNITHEELVKEEYESSNR